MARSYLSFKLTNLSFTHRVGSTNTEKSMPATIISTQPYHGTENGKSKAKSSSSSSFLASSLIFVLILFCCCVVGVEDEEGTEKRPRIRE